MAFTDLTAEWDYKDLITWQALDKVAENDESIRDIIDDGWTPVESPHGTDSTWTYASATTITVPTGAASIYQIGDKIKLTQTTAKYFYIIAVADTLLTVTGGSDYTVANAAITSPYYSKIENPHGFPQWFNTAAPTFNVAAIDNGAGGQPTTTVSAFNIVGRMVTVYLKGNGTKAGVTTSFDFNPTVYPLTGNVTAYRSTHGAVYSDAGVGFVGALVSITTTAWFFVHNAALADNDVINSFGATFSYKI